MNTKLHKLLFKMALPVLLLLLFNTDSSAVEREKSFRLLANAEIHFVTKGTHLQVIFGSSSISLGKGWNKIQASPGIFHLQYSEWGKSFLELDLENKSLHVIKDGVFGTPSGKQNAGQLEMNLQLKQEPGQPPFRVEFQIKNCQMAYDKKSKKIDILIAGMSTSAAEEWETREPAPGIYHVRHASWDSSFWEIDTKYEKASIFHSGGEFGKIGITGSEHAAVRFNETDGPASKNADDSATPLPDLGFNSPAPSRVTTWTENEKRLFSSVLSKGRYDVFVAPFQVQGYAVDRANRSLMTRYLSNAIEKQTRLALPDPTIVSRALGHGVRRLSDEEVFHLANMVNARVVIRGYVGHDLEENMLVTLLVQVRDSSGRIGHVTRTIKLDWNKIPFSDGEPPAEAFRGILEDVVAKLPLNAVSASTPVQYAKGNIPVPDSISSMVKTSQSALQNAYNLQLLGMLYPEDSTKNHVDDFFEREPLFERSLVALEAVSAGSPDYKLLKARAWFYLRSRPAAIRALGEPSTPEEKAFMAFLNGNLPELEKWAEKTVSPIDRLMTMIQLNDLRCDYDTDGFDHEAVAELAKSQKGLELLIARRLMGKDIWNWIPNAFVKKHMDDTFPLKGFDIESLLRAKAVKGEDPEEDEDIDLSIYGHRKKVLEKTPERFASNGSATPVILDSLDLLYQMGEGTLWKKIRLRANAQGLYEEAKKLLDKYEPVYNGHIKHMSWKTITYRQLGYKDRSDLGKQVFSLEKQKCYYAQGQLESARCDQGGYYKNDYPRHWVADDYATDRKKTKEFCTKVCPTSLVHKAPRVIRIDHDLLYSHNKPILLVNYYDELTRLGLQKEAEELIRINEARFSGNPQKTSLLARVAEKKGDNETTAAIFENAIAENPKNWENYWGKGKIYLENGEYAKARAVFDRYPEFKDNNGGGVAFSVNAHQAGYSFLVRGNIADARIFLEKAADNDTGAMVEYDSRTHLAMLDGDLENAGSHLLQSHRRYENFDSIDDYMALLHILGMHEDAWALLNTTAIGNNLPFSAFIGMRMQGIDEDAQMRRLSEDGSSMSQIAAFKYAVLAMMDRAPDANDLKRLNSLGRVEHSSSKAARLLGQAYHYLRKGESSTIYPELRRFSEENIRPLLQDNREYVKPVFMEYRIILPYYAYAAAKTGNKTEAVKLLNEIKNAFGDDYQYQLSMAFINGLDGRHGEAIRNLQAAKNKIGSLLSTPLPQWYKLVDACEWLYNESGQVEYRNMAVEFARTYQKIMPQLAWAYAV
jgi:tetratricopeptide (TPR) repeat protein